MGTLHHATTVSLAGQGIFITGPSGAGKSDLALRLIDTGAILVADDAYLRGERAGGKCGRGSENKVPL